MAGYASPPTTLPPDFTPLSKAPKTGGKVIKIFNAQIPNDVLGFEATKGAAEAVGWTAEGISFNGTPPDFAEKFDQAIAARPDVIMAAGREPETFDKQIAAAKAAGILVEINSTVSPPREVPGFGAGALNVKPQQLNGEIAAQWAMADSGCTADVLIVNLAGFPILKVTTDRMQELFKSQCPSCRVTYSEIQPKDIGTTQGTGSIIGALQSSPTTKYLYLNNSGLNKGLATAIKQANLSGVKIFGVGPDAGAIAGLKDGTNSMWSGGSPVVLAWSAFDSALRALDTGKPVDQPQVAGVSVFTKDNTASITSTPDYPTNYQQLFRTVWRVPGAA
ncbi:MAG: hypothetical protein ABT15_02760 [Pseudonocardia sp. SCN 73-27]|nr:MAG: hypothetical protein ABS80_00315 [Pseudonocardia sp. SCN 72-51]ODV08747.1 MAG: hypothetical protein ABT15_02760 [Pseudonocardia sp. SCN 73-27]